MTIKKRPNISRNVIKKEIVKSNNLIEGSYKLTTSENRLLDLALSKLEVIMLDKDLSAEDVKQRINHSEFELLYVYVTDYKKEYGIKNNTIYTELAKTANRLFNRTIQYYENNVLIKKRWVITCKFDEEKNAVAIQFHPDLIGDLLVFKSDFTTFDFDVKKYIRSYYSCRIYELLKQYQSFGQRIFEVEQLRFLLGIKDTEYPLYANFKQRILKTAVTQISKVTDLYLELDDSSYKLNKKVEKVKFKMVAQPVNYQGKENVNDKPKIASKESEFHIVQDFKELIGLTISPLQIHKFIEKVAIAIKKYKLDTTYKQYIKEKKIVVDEYAKNHDIRSYLGVIIKAIDENWTLTYKKTVGCFNNFEQRDYDYDNLEKKLLGCADNENIATEEVASDIDIDPNK